jgi:hypothetical protein
MMKGADRMEAVRVDSIPLPEHSTIWVSILLRVLGVGAEVEMEGRESVLIVLLSMRVRGPTVISVVFLLVDKYRWGWEA